MVEKPKISFEGIMGKLKNLDQARNWLYHTSYDELKKVETDCLQFELGRACQAPIYQRRLQGNDPTNILNFGTLTKGDYISNPHSDFIAPEQQLKAAHTFETSGTTSRTKYQIPWGEREYDIGFVETSILGMAMGKVNSDDRGLCLASSLGALGIAYQLAGEQTGVKMFFPEQTDLYKSENLEKTFKEMRELKTSLLIGVPDVLYQFTQGLINLGHSPEELKAFKIKTVISGIGNFLTKSHLDYLVKIWDPEMVVEQGGKNEIHHSPGAVRYNKNEPEKICLPGYLHYSPKAMYATVVDTKEMSEGKLVEVSDDTEGVLLMSRLGGGEPGTVSYLNDACDFGKIKRLSPDKMCPCGCNWPMFAFKGRVDGAPTLKYGAKLFGEVVSQALNIAAKEFGIKPEIAAGLRAQLVLVRNPDKTKHDAIGWVIGTDKIDRRIKRLIRDFPKFLNYYNLLTALAAKPFVKIFKKGVSLPTAFLPLTDRGKPGYRAVQEIFAKDKNLWKAFNEYVKELSAKANK